MPGASLRVSTDVIQKSYYFYIFVSITMDVMDSAIQNLMLTTGCGMSGNPQPSGDNK
jgi:hypothetical protein